jgi:rieske iron-sulfur protein
MTPSPDCACYCGSAPQDPDRRRLIQVAALGLLGATALDPARAQNRLASGDRLVSDDVEGKPVALRPADLKPGKPLLAYPFHPASGTVRNESRLDKVVLLRLEESQLGGAAGQAAGGVLAMSAICTHQACEVKTWLAQEQALVCFCHASKFRPLEGGAVVSGPAPRALPMLPLKLENGELVVAGPFSTPPGASN